MHKLKPTIEIDPSAGFCSGVKRAIKSAENLLKSGGEVSCLGEIVHNENEMERLTGLGMRIIGPDDYEIPDPGARVLIRAHGVTPETYKELEERLLSVTDATCPVVLRLQQNVRKASVEVFARQGTIVIFGKQGHPEVIGLQGNAKGNVRVLSHPDDISGAALTTPLHVFAQTTSNAASYKKFCEAITARFPDAASRGEVMLHQTICGQVSKREPALEKFARDHDVVIFVTGSGSSNGKYLSEYCRSVNARTLVVTGPGQLEKQWFAGAARIGVTGATSTPAWLMEEVASAIETMTSEASCT
jgi:4-hydroxy-3-methylbut-2-enyl diphosphate reductase